MCRRGIRLLTALILIGASAPAHSQPDVPRAPHLVTGRYAMPAVEVRGDIYIVGGMGIGGMRTDIERVEVFDDKVSVTAIPTKLIPRHFHTAVGYDRFIYIIGGVTELNTKWMLADKVERYDTQKGTVVELAPLPEPIRTPDAVLIGENIYVSGGGDENGKRLDSTWIYNIPSNTWTKGAAMLERKECDLVVWNGTPIAIGGYDGQVAVKGVAKYDAAKNTWVNLPPLPQPTSANHGDVLDGKVVLFGDYANLDRIQVGNPETGEWRSIKHPKFVPRRHAATITVGEYIYVIGGNMASNNSYLDDIQAFNINDLNTAGDE